jgi:hypothetical protein
MIKFYAEVANYVLDHPLLTSSVLAIAVYSFCSISRNHAPYYPEHTIVPILSGINVVSNLMSKYSHGYIKSMNSLLPIVRFNLLGKTCYMVGDAKLAKQVLTNQQLFQRRRDFSIFFNVLFNTLFSKII